MAAPRERLCKVLSRDMNKAFLQGGLQMMGEVLGDSCLEVMRMHRKVHLPRGPEEVESCFWVCLFGILGISLHQ